MGSSTHRTGIALAAGVLLSALPCTAQVQPDAARPRLPQDIGAVMNGSMYHGSTWGLRVVDLETGRILIDYTPQHQFFIASVRKSFTVGELMDKVGPNHRYNTPVYRQGEINEHGVLQGDLILVASGDLTMGGRANPDGSLAIANFDHNEANDLGNAELTRPNPLAGYRELARQVAASGIRRIAGNVAIDDRLFRPYEFRHQFEMRPIFVNDDVVDAIIDPAGQGELALLRHRPQSVALAVENKLEMTAENPNAEAEIKPALPACIGKPDCSLPLSGTLPVGFVPTLNHSYPLLRAIRITEPSNYARTVFIEALRAAGVIVDAPSADENPTRLLPSKDCYDPRARVAELKGSPVSDDAKLVMKVSYNIGADASLLLWGLTGGVDDMHSALAAEKTNLERNYGISQKDYQFLDGSGDGDTTATNEVVTHFLSEMSMHHDFPEYLASFPILGVDGSLATVTDFTADPSLAGAKGHVFAKTGTYVDEKRSVPTLEGQAFGGYMNTRSGKTLVYQLVVNGVPITGISDIIKVFQDEGRISAILWRDN